MDNVLVENILRFYWDYKLERNDTLHLSSSNILIIEDKGVATNDCKIADFMNVAISLMGVRIIGAMKIFGKTSQWNDWQEKNRMAASSIVLLYVWEEDAVAISSSSSQRILVALSNIDNITAKRYKGLLASSGSICVNHFKEYNNIRRYNFFERLYLERLEDKCENIYKLHDQTTGSWSDTLILALFDTIAISSRNRAIFVDLAKTIKMGDVFPLLGTLEETEALLLGAAGLLENIGFPDEYTFTLRKHFTSISNRYNITPLPAWRWDMSAVHTNVSVPIIIAQLAATLFRNKNILSRLLDTASFNTIRGIFKYSPSEYWCHHNSPSDDRREQSSNRDISSQRIDLVIINCIAPFLFAYYNSKESVNFKEKELIIEYICKMKGENNKITRTWIMGGVVLNNAFESQALIQLSKRYCFIKNCAHCPIGIDYLSKR